MQGFKLTYKEKGCSLTFDIKQRRLKFLSMKTLPPSHSKGWEPLHSACYLKVTQTTTWLNAKMTTIENVCRIKYKSID